jgi:hypothetical protein
MTTIRVRKQAERTVQYTAVIRIRKQRKIVHQEAKTLRIEPRLKNGQRVAKSRSKPRRPQGAATRRTCFAISFGGTSIPSQPPQRQRTKQAQLELLEHHPIGESNAISSGGKERTLTPPPRASQLCKNQFLRSYVLGRTESSIRPHDSSETARDELTKKHQRFSLLSLGGTEDRGHFREMTEVQHSKGAGGSRT